MDFTRIWEHYLHALRVNPDVIGDEDAHINLGSVLNNLGRTEEAIKHYLQALRINPDSEEAHNNLAVSFLYKGYIKRAIAYFRKALQINPDYVPAKNNLKKVLMKQQQKK